MTTQLTLRTYAPFRLDLTVWALRRRPRNAIDSWDGMRYSRVIEIDGVPARLVVSQTAPANDPQLEVLCIHRGRTVAAHRITDLVRRLLGLDVNLRDFYELAETDARLRGLARRFAGFRPPRFPTVFEVAVNAVCCQQLSLEVGIELLNRLAAAAEVGLTKNGPTFFAFPKPCDIARLSEERLRGLGFSRQKAATLINLTRLLSSDEHYLERLAELNNESAQAALLELRGIGRWSAEYILLRGLGRLSVFPADDVAAKKNLKRWLGIDTRHTLLTYDRVRQALVRWHPFEGLIYFHLLLASLAERVGCGALVCCAK
jgi:DNA-3-methyladenine glycosylase II